MIRQLRALLRQPRTDTAARGAIDLRLRLEFLDVAARSGIVAGCLTICVTAFTYLLLLDPFTRPRLTVWSIAMVLVSTLRIGICGRWHGGETQASLRDEPSLAMHGPRIDRWEAIHAAVAFGCGLVWAALVVVTGEDLERMALLVGFALTIALLLASSSYANDRIALLSFSVPIVVAQIVNLQRIASPHPALLTMAWIALMAVLYFVPRVFSLSMRDGLVARVEQERRAAEQNTLLDTAPLGILVVRDERIVVCNDTLVRILGYAQKQDLLGKSVRVLIPDDDAWRQVLGVASLARLGPVPPQIVRRLRRDGSVIEVMQNMAAVRDAKSGSAFIGMYEDIGDRLAMEEGYQHAVRMQRLVFESAGEGIAIVDDGIIEQANQALSDLVGLPASQMTGRSLQSIFEDPEGWAGIERRFERLGNTLKLERRIVRSDGRAIWVNVTGCLVDTPPARPHDPGAVVDGAAKRSIWILADLSVQKQKEAENWHHANHDVMTGLPNRRFLQDRLDQALAFARRDGRRVAVVELDLDGFKSVNDSHGHRFGDAVLEEVARRLSTVVRELDTVGRWGGDEFVLVLKEIESREVVEDTVRRVIARLSEPIVYMGHQLSIGASIGIALFPDHGEEVEVLMLAADLAMYESKGSGGNTWRFASPTAQGPRGKYRPASPQRPVSSV